MILQYILAPSPLVHVNVFYQLVQKWSLTVRQAASDPPFRCLDIYYRQSVTRGSWFLASSMLASLFASSFPWTKPFYIASFAFNVINRYPRANWLIYQKFVSSWKNFGHLCQILGQLHRRYLHCKPCQENMYNKFVTTWSGFLQNIAQCTGTWTVQDVCSSDVIWPFVVSWFQETPIVKLVAMYTFTVFILTAELELELYTKYIYSNPWIVEIHVPVNLCNL